MQNEPYRRFAARLGRRLQSLRKRRGLKQEDMQDFGFTYKYYQRIERPGRNPANPTVKTLLKIAQALKVPIRHLLGP